VHPYPLSEIGGRLRARREARGLSLRALASHLRMSASALSQIETGRSQPSVASLYEICRELGLPLDSLFGGDQVPVQRARSRRALELESGVTWELLTTTADGEVDFLYVSYPPDSCSSEGLLDHDGREYGLVLDGELAVTTPRAEWVLGPGDAIFLDSTAPHRLRNDGAMPVHAVWVVLH